jgi:hypothetical protein
MYSRSACPQWSTLAEPRPDGCQFRRIQTIVFRRSRADVLARPDSATRRRLGRKDFEIHVDVTFEGQSGAAHEIDVSIVDARHSQDVRRTGRLPRTNKHLVCAFECKFYTSAPGVALARTFVGLTRDCSANRLDGFVANRTTSAIDRYLGTSQARPFMTDALIPSAERRFVANLNRC